MAEGIADVLVGFLSLCDQLPVIVQQLYFLFQVSDLIKHFRLYLVGVSQKDLTVKDVHDLRSGEISLS